MVSKRGQTEIEEITAKVSSFSLDEANKQQAYTSVKVPQNDNLCSGPTCSNTERESALDKLLQSLVPAPGATQKEILAYAQQRPFLTPIGKVVNRISPLRTNIIAYVESFKYLFCLFLLIATSLLSTNKIIFLFNLFSEKDSCVQVIPISKDFPKATVFFKNTPMDKVEQEYKDKFVVIDYVCWNENNRSPLAQYA